MLKLCQQRRICQRIELKVDYLKDRETYWLTGIECFLFHIFDNDNSSTNNPYNDNMWAGPLENISQHVFKEVEFKFSSMACEGIWTLIQEMLY